MADAMAHRAGHVSILGLPNAGKSTLLNALLGERLAIISPKPQTTRTALEGVVTWPALEKAGQVDSPAAQVTFVDTPGIHKSDTALNRRMMRTVRAALDGIDLLLYLHDATKRISEESRHSLDLLKKAERPALLVLTKVDLLEDKSVLFSLIEEFRGLYPFADFVPVSVRKQQNLDALKKQIVLRLPEGEAMHEADHLTPMPSKFLAAEMVREKVLGLTSQEVPHAVAVQVEKWEETPKVTRVMAMICVEKEGQKRIVIGEKGSKIKAIGIESRKAMEQFFGRPFYLELFVKVVPGWRENPQFLNELDWRKMVGEEE